MHLSASGRASSNLILDSLSILESKRGSDPIQQLANNSLLANYRNSGQLHHGPSSISFFSSDSPIINVSVYQVGPSGLILDKCQVQLPVLYLASASTKTEPRLVEGRNSALQISFQLLGLLQVHQPSLNHQSIIPSKAIPITIKDLFFMQ